MEERLLNEKESLELITQMINSSKKNHNNGKSKCNLELASSLFFSSEKDDEGIIREQ